MSAWTDDELIVIDNADELRLSSTKKDGSLRHPVIIWMVRIDDDVYVRSINGSTGTWYRHATDSKSGLIEAGGISKNVRFIKNGEKLEARIDAAYQAKYSRYSDSTIGSTLTPEAKAATLKLEPIT